MSVSKPPMTIIGTNSQNLWRGRGQAKLAVVCHIMQGTLAGCDSWFSDPAAQASTNYAVGLDGTIHQYVDPEGPDAPFANGLVNQPDAAVQKLLAQTGNTNLNFVTVSIEHEGNSGDLLTTAQLDASAQLCAWLCERFGIPMDEDHILGHYEIDSVTRAGCPGWNRVAWLRYEAAVARFLAPAPVPQPPTPVDPCAESKVMAWRADVAALVLSGDIETAKAKIIEMEGALKS